jgi:hypothetical protein
MAHLDAPVLCFIYFDKDILIRCECLYTAVWRIRDVYPGSRIRLFSIPDPNCLHPGSRILIKEFKYGILTPQKAKKWFQCSKKYDPGCSFRIPDPGSGC